MKRILTFTLSLLCTFQLMAQAPNSINYQAVLRNSAGALIQQSSVSLRLSILKGSATGSTVYSETHSVTTTKYGVANLQIGNGSTSDKFSEIAWGTDAYYLKIEMDENGGSSYKNMGVTQFVAVPYALYANKAKEVENNNDGDQDDKNEIQTLSQTGNVVSLSKNGGSVTINVDDADANASNELQKISLTGNKLTLDQNGGTVTLPSAGGSVWKETGDTAFYPDFVKIGDPSVANGAVAVIGATTQKDNTALEVWAKNGTTNYALTAAADASTNDEDENAAVFAIVNTDNGIGNAVYAEAYGTGGASALRSFAETGGINIAGEFNTSSLSNNRGGQIGVLSLADGSGTGNHVGVSGEAYGNGVFNIGGDFRVANNGKSTGDIARAGQFITQDTSAATFNQGILVLAEGPGSGTNTSNTGMLAIARGNSVLNIGVRGNTDATGSNNVGLEGVANGTTTNGTNYGVFGSASNAGTNYAGYFSGNLSYTGSLIGPSDAKLKNGVQPMVSQFSALQKIDSLRPVYYTYKRAEFPSLNLPGGQQYGFIAQDLQKVFPYLVEKQIAPGSISGGESASSDSLDIQTSKTDKVEYNGINYIGLIPVLTQGIQEQQAQIDVLKEEMELLKKQNELLLQLLEEQKEQ